MYPIVNLSQNFINPAVVQTMSDNLKKIILDARQSIAPPEKITVSQWSEKYRQLPSYANMSGSWKNKMVPHAVAIMDAFTNPEVEEITVQGSAQIAKTEILNNVIGYYIHIDPKSILVVQPTIESGKKFSKEKLEAMIEDTKEVRERVAKKKNKDSDNVTLHKRFYGGFVAIVGANSPHGLRQLSIAIVLSDDIDSIEKERGKDGIKEGDPILRAEKRTKTFKGQRKKARFSTPTIKNFSRIERFYNQSNKMKFYVPCPHCSQYQILSFKSLKWEKEKNLLGKTDKHFPETVYYECGINKCKIYEKDKFDMLQKGEWRSEKPEIKSHYGFWINELYSMFSTWQEIVEDFLKAKDDKEALETFTNLSLGLTFEKEEYGKLPDFEELIKRNENYLTENKPYIPNGSLILVCTVDTQADRLEVLVKAWGLQRESWLIHYEQLFGDPDQSDVWAELDALRERIWTREDGVQLSIAIVGIDSGGKNTPAVYEYVRERQYQNVIALKGRSVYGRHILLNRSKVGRFGDVILQNINVDAGKELVYTRLRNKEKSGEKVMHFPSAFCTDEYYKGLVSEKPIREYDRNLGIKIRWKKHTKDTRNEPLDLEVYNIAMLESLYPNFELTKERLDEVALSIKGVEQPKQNNITIPRRRVSARRISR